MLQTRRSNEQLIEADKLGLVASSKLVVERVQRVWSKITQCYRRKLNSTLEQLQQRCWYAFLLLCTQLTVWRAGCKTWSCCAVLRFRLSCAPPSACHKVSHRGRQLYASYESRGAVTRTQQTAHPRHSRWRPVNAQHLQLKQQLLPTEDVVGVQPHKLVCGLNHHCHLAIGQLHGEVLLQPTLAASQDRRRHMSDHNNGRASSKGISESCLTLPNVTCVLRMCCPVLCVHMCSPCPLPAKKITKPQHHSLTFCSVPPGALPLGGPWAP